MGEKFGGHQGDDKTLFRSRVITEIWYNKTRKKGSLQFNKNMLSIQVRRILVFALTIGLVFSFSAVTFAEDNVGTTTEDIDDTTTTEEIVEDIQGEDAHGILPTNPFYFFKEFSRGIRRFFIFNPVRRAEFELDVLEEKAEELEIVESLSPENINALNRAIENYDENVDRLRENLERLSEESDNPNIDELLERLNERMDRHNELFDELIERHQDLLDSVNGVRGRFGETVSNLMRMRHADDDGDEDSDEDSDDDATGTDDIDDNDEDRDADEDIDDDEDIDENEDENEDEDGSSGGQRSRFRDGISCIELFSPVCGDDGRTYSNECFAEIADVEVVSNGACRQ